MRSRNAWREMLHSTDVASAMHLKEIASSPISSFPAAIRSGTLDLILTVTRYSAPRVQILDPSKSEFNLVEPVAQITHGAGLIGHLNWQRKGDLRGAFVNCNWLNSNTWN